MKLIINSLLLAFMPSVFAATTTTTAVVATASEWAQCGGIGFTGPTVCPAGWTCVYANAYHSQCLVVSTTSASPTSTSTTTSTSVKSASTTTTTAATTTVITSGEWGQCGGIGWPGPYVCPDGWTCTYSNAYHSQCLLTSTTSTSPTSTSTTTTTTTTTAAATTVVTAGEWGQCGGVSWTGPTACPPGWTCVWENEWYSNCFPAPSTTSASSNPTATTKPKTTTTTRGY